MKKILFVFVCILTIIGSVSCVFADESSYGIFYNGELLDTISDVVIADDGIYINPKTVADVFDFTFSSDTSGKIYTYSNKLRSATFDTDTGSLNVSDLCSFSYKIEDSVYETYKIENIDYIPLAAICSGFGFDSDIICDGNNIYITGLKDSIGFFNSEGVAIAQRGNKYGLVDSNGNIVLRFTYDAIFNYDNELLYKVTYNHRCGLVNYRGDFVTDIIYNEIIYESPQMIYLEKDGYKGMCNIHGYMIIPTLFDEVLYCGNNFAMVKNGDNWHLYNCSNDHLYSKTYDEVYKITTGVQSDNSMIQGYYVKKDEKWGCIDSFGNTVIEIKYEALDKFDIFGRARVIFNGKFGIVDCGGRVIIPTAFDYIDTFGSLNVTVAMIGDKYGIINSDFNMVTSFEYDYIYPFNDADTTIAYKDNMFAVISADGTLVTDFKYLYMEDFQNGMSLAYVDGYGFVNHKGEEVIECVHQDFKQGTALSFFLKKDGKWALFSPLGENLTGFCYYDAGSFSNGLSAVSVMTDIGKRYGYVNDSGDVIIPYIYTNALEFKYGKAIAAFGTKFGIIDVENRTVIPFIYAGFNPSYDYNVIAAADEDGKWGLISFNNERLTAFDYDYIFEFEDNYAYTLKNGKYGMIDTSGNVVAETVFENKDDAYKYVFQNQNVN